MKLYQRLAIYVLAGAVLGFFVMELPHAKRFSYQALVKKMEIPEMASDADLIFSGTVEKNLGSTREIGPAGDDMVYTRWLVKPGKSLKGTAPKPVVVRTLGGQYNFTIMDVEDQPTFSVGERVVLFLQSQADWKGDYQIVGGFQGKYNLSDANGIIMATQAETNSESPLADLEQRVGRSLQQ